MSFRNSRCAISRMARARLLLLVFGAFAMMLQALRCTKKTNDDKERRVVGPYDWDQALAPVYDRSPTRQNHEASTKAAADPTTRAARPMRSSRPEIACAGTVTATPIGTALDSVTRSHPG